MMQEKIIQLTTPLLTGNSVAEKRAELKAYFDNSWQTYESLFALINNDNAYFLRPEPLRHPLIFYYGHTATFYINKLMLGKFISERIEPKLEAICAVGVDEMSWDDLDSTHYDWPDVKQVREYRQKVYLLVHQLIDTMPLSLPITQDSLAWIILMGCEHERIHLETSSVIMRMLPLEHLTLTSPMWQACRDYGQSPENTLVPVAGKHIVLGKANDDDTYGWDNEYGECPVDVEPIEASQFLVSNGEFMAFVEAGGYQNSEYWGEEGQSWLAYTQAQMPRFWCKLQDQYFQRNLLELIPLPLNWPVEVNYLEAKAFCQWKSQQSEAFIRLPTEAEWYCLRQNISGDITDWPEISANINLAYYASSCPVNRYSHDGMYDIVGNVWQWTESAIDGFPGFKVHPLYDDFSTPTFDGKHNLIKGGSWISTGNEAIASSRYAFRRHFFQHAGFRYVKSSQEQVPTIKVSHFENDIEICQLLQRHYLPNKYTGTSFAKKLAELVMAVSTQHKVKTHKLLNYGCGVGRTAFELAASFDMVDAVDFSARTIQHAVAMQQHGHTRFVTIESGDIVQYHEVTLADLALVKPPSNIYFSQGDISNLKQVYQEYDVIVVQQALEKSYHPKNALLSCLSRLETGGLLVVASDGQFDERYTEKPLWLGGIKVNGENLVADAGISDVLSPQAKLLATYALSEETQLNSTNRLVTDIQVMVWQKF
ncbi:5-histidylcysteine sulfoxide synthase [Thalassotalea fusca]